MKILNSIVLVLILSSSFGQSKTEYDAVFDSLEALKKYDDIIVYFEKLLPTDPDNEDFLRSLGFAYIATNQFEIGEGYYRRALEINPQCGRCYFQLGNVASKKGDFKKTMEYFDKGISLDPFDATLYSNRAMLKEYLGDLPGALSDHNKAIELDPSSAVVYTERGKYYANKGSNAMAIVDLTKAIKLDPGDYHAHYARSSVYFSQSRYNDALTDVNNAIDLDSTDYLLFLGRAAVYVSMMEYKKAVDDYTKSISLNDTDPTAYLYRAETNYELENLDAACADYSIVKTRVEAGFAVDSTVMNKVITNLSEYCNQENPGYYYQRGIGYYNLGEFQQAVDIYRLGLDKFPEHCLMHSFNGNALMANGQFEEAIDAYHLSLEYKDHLIDELRTNMEFTGQSETFFEKYCSGLTASIYFSLSSCHLFLSHFDHALTDISTAIDILPTSISEMNPEEYFNMRGLIYLHFKKFDLALADLNKSISINQYYAPAYANLALAKAEIPVRMKSITYDEGRFAQPIYVRLDPGSKSAIKKKKDNLEFALLDLNKTLDMDKSLAYGYYIRGQIKQLLQHPDYCADYIKAESMGTGVEEELIGNCR